jgi:ribosomal protein S18 acetylase RimI-like enzyme
LQQNRPIADSENVDTISSNPVGEREDAVKVRLLRPEDLPIATELLRQLGYVMSSYELAGRIDQVLASGTHYAAVAEDGASVIGLVHAYERPALEKPREAVVQSLVVDTRARNAGTGRLLMAAAEAWARAKGLTNVVLHTRIDRDDARAFYEHIGYSRAATSHLMGKPLKGV